MNIFLTGGSGFIGHWVVKEYLKQGHALRLLVRNTEKIPSLNGMPGVEVVQGEIYDKDVIEKALQGCDACVCLALGWGETPQTMLENDTAATVFMLEAAEQAGVERFLYTSSTAAVGEFRGTMDESIDLRPTDLYGATKMASEAYILGFSAKVKMRCNIIRPGYTFANPAFPDGVTQSDSRFRDIVVAAKAGKPVPVTKHDGTQFIWAGDIARLYTAVLNSNCDRRVFFGLSTEFVTWEQIARKAVEMVGSKSEVVVEEKGLDSEPAVFDMGMIKREFGLEFVCRDRIEEHLKWFLDNTQ